MGGAPTTTLQWYLEHYAALAEADYSRKIDRPVLLHTPDDMDVERMGWKTVVAMTPTATATATARGSSAKALNPATTRVMLVEKTARNPYRHRVYLGRASTNDLVTGDAAVSKIHAFFSHENEMWFLTDVGSRNGSSIARVELQPMARQQLPEEAMLVFGTSYLVHFFLPNAFWRLMQTYGKEARKK